MIYVQKRRFYYAVQDNFFAGEVFFARKHLPKTRVQKSQYAEKRDFPFWYMLSAED
jgi:hypothetical protein